MPDTKQQSKDKDSSTEADSKEAEKPSPVPSRRRSRSRWQYLAIGFAAFIAFIWGGLEVHDRLAYVHEVDARIQTNLITVSSRVSGWVSNISASLGDTIVKGGILAMIDDRESQLRLAELEAQVSGIQAERTRARADLELVNQQTKSRLVSARANKNAAKVSVSSLRPQRELAKRELKRSQKLFAKRVISRRQLDQSEARHERIDREYRLALAELKSAEAKVQESIAERAKIQVMEADISVLQQKEAEYNAKIRSQALDFEDRVIRSPVNGVVDRVFVESGEYVTPGQRIALIHDPTEVWIEANIKETEIRKVRIGQHVEISVDAYPDKMFKGTVKSIGDSATSEFALLPTPNPSGNFTKITQRLPVRVRIEQQGRKFRPGMMVIVRIDVSTPDSAAQAATNKKK
jgi:membrane fusion protein (multidrug efflux system)